MQSNHIDAIKYNSKWIIYIYPYIYPLMLYEEDLILNSIKPYMCPNLIFYHFETKIMEELNLDRQKISFEGRQPLFF